MGEEIAIKVMLSVSVWSGLMVSFGWWCRGRYDGHKSTSGEA